MHWLEFKPQLLLLCPRGLWDKWKSQPEPQKLVTAKLGNSHSCLWAGLAHYCYSGHRHAPEIPALGCVALAAQDPLALFATESEFWASLLVSGLHSCPKVTKGQTHWPEQPLYIFKDNSGFQRIYSFWTVTLLFHTRQFVFVSVDYGHILHWCALPNSVWHPTISPPKGGTATQSLQSDPPTTQGHTCACVGTRRPNRGLLWDPLLPHTLTDTASLRPWSLWRPTWELLQWCKRCHMVLPLWGWPSGETAGEAARVFLS